jgi:hypothetical protein
MRLIRTFLIATLVALAALTIAPSTGDSPVASAAMESPSAGLTPDIAARATRELTWDERHANELLETLQAKYRHLEGVTVEFGDTPNGEEAVAYYTEGEIVISASHTVSIRKILAHEIWHVIDWRDNGQIDWGEDLPPNSLSDYLK